ncbi:hypothetical protein D3C75_874170 [compost metagenome]
MGDAIHLAVDNELVLQHSIDLILVLVFIPQIGNVRNPAFFDEELRFCGIRVEEGRCFIGSHFHADFTNVVLPVVFDDLYIRVFRLEPLDFVILLSPHFRQVRCRIMDLNGDLTLSDVICRRIGGCTVV